VFYPGILYYDVIIDIIDDNLPEDDESFYVEVSAIDDHIPCRLRTLHDRFGRRKNESEERFIRA